MVTPRFILLQEWARQSGMFRISVWRMFRDGTLPPQLQAHNVGSIVYVLLADPAAKLGRAIGYAWYPEQTRNASWNRKPIGSGLGPSRME